MSSQLGMKNVNLCIHGTRVSLSEGFGVMLEERNVMVLETTVRKFNNVRVFYSPEDMVPR